jgi:hypothetical protein
MKYMTLQQIHHMDLLGRECGGQNNRQCTQGVENNVIALPFLFLFLGKFESDEFSC